jgi:hypothetical protein
VELVKLQFNGLPLSICFGGQLLYGWKDYHVYFTPNKQRLFLTSEQEVMVILVDGVQTFTGLRGIKNKTPQFIHKCRTFRDFSPNLEVSYYYK